MTADDTPDTDDNSDNGTRTFTGGEYVTDEFDGIRQRANELGCFMQLFVAYNPDDGKFVFSSNSPGAERGEFPLEAALLVKLAGMWLLEKYPGLVPSGANQPSPGLKN